LKRGKGEDGGFLGEVGPSRQVLSPPAGKGPYGANPSFRAMER
jgi:hypothetical protein